MDQANWSHAKIIEKTNKRCKRNGNGPKILFKSLGFLHPKINFYFYIGEIGHLKKTSKLDIKSY